MQIERAVRGLFEDFRPDGGPLLRSDPETSLRVKLIEGVADPEWIMIPMRFRPSRGSGMTLLAIGIAPA